MKQGLDDLIDFLLEKISVRGDAGARYDDLKTWAQQFYAKGQTDEDPTAPGPGLPVAKVDDNLCKRLWGWLTKRDDLWTEEINVSERNAPVLTRTPARKTKGAGTKGFKGKTAIVSRDIVPGPATQASEASPTAAMDRENHQTTPSSSERHVHVPDNADESGTPASKEPDSTNQHDQQTSTTKKFETFIFANEDRMWRSLCGHEPDHQKVFPSQLHLLTIIAAYGEAGILQPNLVQISGQDKRSVPKRTDLLHEHGYIKKYRMVANGQRTSRCIFWKYVKRSSRDQSVYQQSNDPVRQSVVFEGGVSLERFLEVILPMIKPAKDFTWRDIQDKCSLPVLKGKPYARKLLRNLEELGIIRKVHSYYDNGGRRYQRWRYVRDPTLKEKFMFCKFGKSALEQQALAREGDDAQESGDQPSRDGEIEDAQASSSSSQKGLMKFPWTPHRPTTNQLFDVIDKSGVDGISAVRMRSLMGTQFYKKPIENLMSRLSDMWQISQPPHLRHLSIVRDTALSGKIAHFQYRTFANFQSAVDLGKTSWEIFENLSFEKISELKSQAEVNSFNFEPLPSILFLNGTGTASPKECLEAVNAPLKYRVQSLDYILHHSKKVGAGVNKRKPGRSKGNLDFAEPRLRGRKTGPRGRPRKPLPDSAQTNDPPVRKTGKPFTETKIWKEWMNRCHSQAMRAAVTEFGESASNGRVRQSGDDGNANLLDQQPASASEQKANAHASNAKKELQIVGGKRAAIDEPEDPRPSKAAKTDSKAASDQSRSAHASDTSVNEEIGSEKRPANGELEDQRPSKVVKIDAQAASESKTAFGQRVETLQAEYSDLSRPAAYLNPPQRLVIKKGRPRHQLLMVLKSERLRSLGWFKQTRNANELYLPARDAKGRIPGAVYEYPKWDTKKTKKKGRPRRMISETNNEQDDEQAPETPTQENDDTTPTMLSAPRTARGRAKKVNYVELAEGSEIASETATLTRASQRPHKKSKIVILKYRRSNGPNSKSDGEALGKLQTTIDNRTSTSANLEAKTTERINNQNSIDVTSVKKKRGRPKKNPVENALHPQATSSAPIESSHENIVEKDSRGLPSPNDQQQSLEGDSNETAGNLDEATSQPLEGGSGFNNGPRAPEDESDPQTVPPNLQQPLETEKPSEENTQSHEETSCHQLIVHDSMEVDDESSGLRNTTPSLGAVEASQSPPGDHRPAIYGEDVETQELDQDTAMSGFDNTNISPGETDPILPNTQQNTRLEDNQNSTGVPRDRVASNSSPVSPPVEANASIIQHSQPPQESQDATEPTGNRDPSEGVLSGTILHQEVHSKDPNEAPATKTHRQKMAVSRSGGSVAQQRNKTILGILEQANGAYPAGRELAIAFSHAYLKSGSQNSPDPQTATRTVRNLMESGRLCKITFAFCGYGGVTYMKSLIYLPHLLPNSDTVKSLQAKMIDNGANNYFPEEVEVPERNRNPKPLTRRKDGDEAQPKTPIGNRRASGRKRVEPAWKGWARKTARVRVESDSDDDDDDEDISSEQAAMQNSFQLENFTFQPSKDALIGPNPRGSRISRRLKFTSAPKKARAASQQVDKNHPSSIAEKAKARREKARAKRKKAQLARSTQIEPIYIDPYAWILDPVEAKKAATKRKEVRYTTLTDPGQILHPSSGTFSTEFAVTRKPIPQLKISPDAYRDFEEQMPRDIDDIIRENDEERQKKPSTKAPSATAATATTDPFQAIEEIKQWEERNKELLTSNKALMQAVFINYLPEEERFKEAERAAREGITTIDQRAGKNVRWADEVDETQTTRKTRKTRRTLKDPAVRKPSGPTPAPTRESHPRAAKANRKSWAIDPSAWPLEASSDEDFIDFGEVDDAQQESPSQRRKPNNDKAAIGTKATESGPTLTKKRKQRLVCLVVAVRTLLGGKSQEIDWDRILKIFNVNISKERLEERWPAILEEYQNTTKLIQSRFEDDFLDAYSANELPPIDFQNLDGYDWEKAISWMLRSYIDVPKKTPEPPPLTDRETLEDFHVVEDEEGSNDIKWKNLLFHPGTTATYVKRVAAARDATFSVPAKRKISSPSDADADKNAQAFAIAQNYVRANGFTPDEKYDAQHAAKRLKTCGETILPRAVQKLCKDGVLKHRKGQRIANIKQFGKQDQRNYVVHNQHNAAYKRNTLPGGMDVFRDAVSHKYELDAQFLASRENTKDKSRNGSGVTSEKRASEFRGPSGFKAANKSKQLQPQSSGKNNKITSAKIAKKTRKPRVGPRADVPRNLSDGHALLLMNEFANRRIKMRVGIPKITTDVPSTGKDLDLATEGLSIFGLMRGYNSRTIDRTNTLFPLEATPTGKYEEGVRLFPPPPGIRDSSEFGGLSVPTFAGRKKYPFPFWYSIQDEVLPTNWRKVVSSVLSKVATQPGISEEGILQQLGSAAGLELWEWRAVMGWLERVGLVKKIEEAIAAVGEGNARSGHAHPSAAGGGWVVREGWWSVLGGLFDDESSDEEEDDYGSVEDQCREQSEGVAADEEMQDDADILV